VGEQLFRSDPWKSSDGLEPTTPVGQPIKQLVTELAVAVAVAVARGLTELRMGDEC
jgi:hypothetical protein